MPSTGQDLVTYPAPQSAQQAAENRFAPDLTTPSPFAQELGSQRVQSGIKLYEHIKPKLESLKRVWDGEITDTKNRRAIRKMDIDVNKLRSGNGTANNGPEIAIDETFIPIRLADTNITRESVNFVTYFTQSFRAGIFLPQQNPGLQPQVPALEEEFTRVYRYLGWQVPYFEVVDGSRAHGWDSIELCKEDSMPGGFCFKHIGHDKLLFPGKVTDIQSCDCITIIKEIPAGKLMSFIAAPHGFDAAQVKLTVGEEYVASLQPGSPEIVEPMCKIGKCMYRSRENGLIYVAWYDYEQKATDWLKAPVPLYLGVDKIQERQVEDITIDAATLMPMPTTRIERLIIPEFETRYPVFILPFRITEEPEISAQVGRIFLDEPKQDALTSMWTSIVNGMTRAGNIYASIRNSDPANPSGKPKLLDVEIRPNGVYDVPIEFFSPPYPDPVLLSAIQALEMQNANDTNQIAWGVNNRKDSRKTAEEVKASKQQNAQISSMELVVFSLFESQMLDAAWRITRSKALINSEFNFLRQVPEPTRSKLIAEPYQLAAPGATDVVERDETIGKISSILPQIQGTDLGSIMFADLMTLIFPKRGEFYKQVLNAQMQKQDSLAALGSIIQGLLQQFGQQIPPEQLQQITQIMQQAQQSSAAQQQPRQ